MGVFSVRALVTGLARIARASLTATVALMMLASSAQATPDTGQATAIGATLATVTGTIAASGSADRYHFEYGTTPAYGFKTGAVATGGGGSPTAVSAALHAGLSPLTTYHFRIVESYSVAGSRRTSFGTDQTFTTLGCSTTAAAGESLQTFLDSLTPGAVGCLGPGTWGGRGQAIYFGGPWGQGVSGTSSAPIELIGYPSDSKPTVLGAFRVGGDHITVSGIRFAGPTGNVGNDQCHNGEDGMVWMYGSDDQVDHSEISGGRCHFGVFVGTSTDRPTTPVDDRILNNYIHDNGDFSDPAQANEDQGIYVAQSRGAVIANNILEHNVAFGIQLYPNPTDTTVIDNTSVDNGRSGIIIGGDGSQPRPAHNLIAENIADGNGWSDASNGFGIRSGSDAPLGSNNRVQRNVVFGNSAGAFYDPVGGLTIGDGNIQADPSFSSSLGGGPSAYRLRPGSPAIGAGDMGMPDDYGDEARAGPGGFDIGAYEADSFATIARKGRPSGGQHRMIRIERVRCTLVASGARPAARASRRHVHCRLKLNIARGRVRASLVHLGVRVRKARARVRSGHLTLTFKGLGPGRYTLRISLLGAGAARRNLLRRSVSL